MVPGLIYIWKWSIHYSSLSAIFTQLYSSMNQKLFKKYVCNQSSHWEKYDCAMYPNYGQKSKYPLPSLSAMLNSLHSSTNQKLFEKHLCNQGSHYEKYRHFLIT